MRVKEAGIDQGKRGEMIEHAPSVPHRWDIETDVVVAGFGAAGFAASVTAHDLGTKVLILEKAPEGQHGGNTRVAGKGYLNTSSANKAAAYLRARHRQVGREQAW
jgi:succinate dehydrogenase/fumarate reductase flavoprotein subunit